MQPIPVSLLDAQRLCTIAHIISNHTASSNDSALRAAAQCLGYQDVKTLTAAIQNPIDMPAYSASEIEKLLRSNMNAILGKPIPEIARLAKWFCSSQTLDSIARTEMIQAITSSSVLNQQIMTYASFMQNEPIQCLTKVANKLKKCLITDHVADSILQEGNFFKLSNQAISRDEFHFSPQTARIQRAPINTSTIPYVHLKHERVSLIAGLPTYLDEILYSQCPKLMNKHSTIRPLLICAFCTATGKHLWQASFYATPKGIKRTTPMLASNPYTLQRLEIKPSMMDESPLANDAFSSLKALCGPGGILEMQLEQGQDETWTLTANETCHTIPNLGIVIHHHDLYDSPSASLLMHID